MNLAAVIPINGIVLGLVPDIGEVVVLSLLLYDVHGLRAAEGIENTVNALMEMA